MVPLEKLKSIKATVVGCGAGGRQICLQLATIGVPNLHLIDFDKVEVVNLASQGFYEKDLGQFKVDAVAATCKEIDSQINIKTTKAKFNPMMFGGGVIFSCTDSMSARRQVFESTSGLRELLIDARTSSEYSRIFIIDNSEESTKHYEKSLFSDDEAHTGSCTAKMTFYVANVSAGIRVAQFAKWLRNIPIDREICINLLSNEMICK